MRHARAHRDVTIVTSAARSHSDDINLRQRRYVITQGVRAVCVLLAATLPIPVFWKCVLMLAAVALPWFGVVMANAGPTVQRRRRTALLEHPVEQPPHVPIERGRIIDQD